MVRKVQKMFIQNAKLKRSVLTALADDDMVNILNSTQDELKSVIDIIQEYNIAHTTAYRKIKWMVENDLLIVEKIKLTDDGKKASMFKSTIRAVKINYENRQVNIKTLRNSNKITATAKEFFSLDDDIF